MTKPTRGGPRKGAGRPRLGPGKGREGVVISARVSQEERKRLKAHCAQFGLTESSLIRYRLRDVLEED